ncbi:MAG: hypothetical protein QNK36_16610 [Colwellia sp.]|nr:hypothetical protein [Colwellia sp.]
MDDLKKHALLITVMAMLVTVKFIILPVFTWQGEVLSEIVRQEKKLAKVKKVLNNDGQENKLGQRVISDLVTAEQLFFSLRTESDFKLEQQQLIEGFIEKNHISLTNLGWKSASELKEVAIKRYQVSIRFNGLFVDVVTLFSELESHSPWLKIEEFNLSSKVQSNDDIGYIKGGRATINLYMNTTKPNAKVVGT